ncbi:hypothetical protein JCM24511_03452 [Saitozyma sp. JCM 24511]|nr:hypothetical protein JCM24511_03452 [Saitozyma sp. JCM 24511]
MFGSRRTHAHAHHGSYRENRIRGLRAAINNPRTTHHGRVEAKHELHAMGARSNRYAAASR